MIVWLMYPHTHWIIFHLLGAAVAEASLQHLLLQSLRGMMTFIFIFLCGLTLQITLANDSCHPYFKKNQPNFFVLQAML